MDTIIWYISGTNSGEVKGYRASCTVSSCSLTQLCASGLIGKALVCPWIKPCQRWGDGLHTCQIQQYDLITVNSSLRNNVAKESVHSLQQLALFCFFYIICFLRLSSLLFPGSVQPSPAPQGDSWSSGWSVFNLHVMCQLLGAPGSALSGVCKSLYGRGRAEVVGGSHSRPVSGSGDSERSSSVPASEEQAEHRSSEEKLRLPNLASELDRLSLEGTVRPASRMRVSISCALWSTRPGLPLTLRRLSLLELRVRVEPWGEEVGVCSPGPTTPNKPSLVSGITIGSNRTWQDVEDFVKSLVKLQNCSSSSVRKGLFLDLWQACKGLRDCRISWGEPESLSSRSARRRTSPDLWSCSRGSWCWTTWQATAGFSSSTSILISSGRASERAADCIFSGSVFPSNTSPLSSGWTKCSGSPGCSSLMRGAVDGEAAQLAQSHRGPQGRSSPTEDATPSEEI